MQIFCMCVFKQSALIPFSEIYGGGGVGGGERIVQQKSVSVIQQRLIDWNVVKYLLL